LFRAPFENKEFKPPPKSAPQFCLPRKIPKLEVLLPGETYLPPNVVEKCPPTLRGRKKLGKGVRNFKSGENPGPPVLFQTLSQKPSPLEVRDPSPPLKRCVPKSKGNLTLIPSLLNQNLPWETAHPMFHFPLNKGNHN